MTNIQANQSTTFHQNSIFSPSESKSIQGFLTEFDEDPIIKNLSDQTSTLSPHSHSKMINFNNPNSSFQPSNINYQSNWNSPLKSHSHLQFNRSNPSNPLQIEFEPNQLYSTLSHSQPKYPSHSQSHSQSQSQSHSQNQNQSQNQFNPSNPNQFSTLEQSSYKPSQKSNESYHHHQSDLPPFSLISTTNQNPSSSFDQLKTHQSVSSTPWIDKPINYHPTKFNPTSFNPNEKLNSQQLLQKHRHHQSLDSSIYPTLKPKQTRTSSNHLIHQPNPSILYPDRIPSSSSSSSNSSSNHSNHTNQSFQQPPPQQHPPSNLNTHQPHHHQAFNHHQSLERNMILAVPASVLKKDKPGLLSQEQKRANHIASEQKRRAAIRQGYDKLCSVVPSLSYSNTDWKEEEERLSGKKKRKKSNGSLNSGPTHPANSLEEDNPKSGSKSEAIVLAKTVEYLKELEIERESLLNRYKTLEKVVGTTTTVDGQEISNHKLWEEKWNVIVELKLNHQI